MRFIFFTFVAIASFLYSCDVQTENNNSSDIKQETAEDKALLAVESLPEFKEANIQINAITNGKQSISCIIDAPTDDDPNFYIQAGYNQESWFESYYIFIVNAKTFDVYIEDVIIGDVISIDVWRKREEQR